MNEPYDQWPEPVRQNYPPNELRCSRCGKVQDVEDALEMKVCWSCDSQLDFEGFEELIRSACLDIPDQAVEIEDGESVSRVFFGSFAVIVALWFVDFIWCLTGV